MDPGCSIISFHEVIWPESIHNAFEQSPIQAAMIVSLWEANAGKENLSKLR